MGRLLIVSKIDMLEEHLEIAKEYDVSFEINDFFEPDVLDDEARKKQIIELYKKNGIPKNSTMHGAFYDIAVFSRDAKIREVSQYRMEQSMQIARELGVCGVVFHTNCNPGLSDETYSNGLISSTADYLKILLEKYPDINIYVENMFDANPNILKGISQALKGYINYGVCLDWAHANIYSSAIGAWIEDLAGFVKHIHINDNDLISDLHLSVGSGRINWEFFAECYWKYFNKSSVLVETNKPKDQRESLEFLKVMLRSRGC